MINTLVSLDADLASSIAFRYSCRLSQIVDMHLQTIHVEEVEKEGYPPGSGWVRSTWEKGLLQTAREEISQLINAERSDCHPVDKAIIRIGNREDALLKEIDENAYDLLVEGVLNSFEAQLFYQKVHSKLYKYARCPILLVKNLVDIDQVALLMSDAQDVSPLVAGFLKLFDKSKVAVDLVHFTIKKAGQAMFRKPVADATAEEMTAAGPIIEAVATQLEKHDWKPNKKWVVRDTSKNIGEMMDAYGLVTACIPNSASKRNIVVDLLSRVPSATLLCKQ